MYKVFPQSNCEYVLKLLKIMPRHKAWQSNEGFINYAWYDVKYPRRPEEIKQSKIIGHYYNLVETNQSVKCTCVLRCSNYANVEEALKTVNNDSEFAGVVDKWV